jgi:hypothetical protein
VSILSLELNPKYVVGSAVSRSRCRLLISPLACLLAHCLPTAGTCEFGLGDVNGNVDVQSFERSSERRQLPCVSSGKSPQRPRVGMPKLDIIHDHQWDVFVVVNVEVDVWRKERIC